MEYKEERTTYTRTREEDKHFNYRLAHTVEVMIDSSRYFSPRFTSSDHKNRITDRCT
jgi:hypothetical protein